MQHNDRLWLKECLHDAKTTYLKAGDTLHEIGKMFDRPHTSIHLDG